MNRTAFWHICNASFLLFSGLLFSGLLCSAASGQGIPDPRTATPQQAADFLSRSGAVFTTDDSGRYIGFQMPETRGLHEQNWPYFARLTDLQDLDWGALTPENQHLQYLRPLTKMRNLNLFGCPIDSIALQNITGMQQLETLYLYRTFVDDDAIPHIAQLKNLKRLNLFDTFLSDEGLDQLAQCKQLRYLTIGNSHAGNFPESSFTDAGVKRLRDALPETKIFIWGKTDRHDTPMLVSASATREKVKRSTNLNPMKVSQADNLASRTVGNDWAAFLGPTGDGKSGETNLRTDWNTQLPKLRWHKKVGIGFAAPSIAKGRLLLYHRVRTDDPKARSRFAERLACMHAETGEDLWKVDFLTQYEDLSGYGDGPRCTPVIDGDQVYLLSPEGMLRCLQLVDGKSIWEVDLAREFQLNFIMYGVGSTPVVHDNRLIVAVGGKHESVGHVGLVAFDKRTGVFQFGVGDDDANYASPKLVRHAGRDWCFAFMRDGLVAFDPNNGDIDAQFTWRSNVAGSVNAASPVVKDNQVFITESYTNGGAMLHFAPGKLTPIWKDTRKREKIMASHWATPIEHNGFLYGCSGRHSAHGALKCVDWATGTTRWEEKMSNRTSMIYADGHFISLGENGRLRCIRVTPDGFQETGRIDKENAQVLSSYPAWAAPVLSHGLLYIRGKHELICYDLLVE